MKTKIFSLFLMLMISIGTVFASDSSVNVGGIWYDLWWGTYAEVTYHGSYYCQYSDRYSGNVIIPPSITYGGKTYNVESISAEAFCNCRGLTSVDIPNSVKTIGEKAFYGCTSLTSVTIGNYHLTKIGEKAFSVCSSLQDVHIADIAKWCAINFVDPGANPLICAKNLYVYSQLITDLVIPHTVTSIGKNAFNGCNSLTSVTIPNSVTSIGCLFLNLVDSF